MKTSSIPEGRLYGELIHLTALLAPPQEYAAGAACWKAVLREKLGPGRHPILELGVGGGNNLSHLTADFEATAVDLSEAMLSACRERNPGVEIHQGDMRTVRLGRKFSAVLIHDAINYMLSEDDLRAAFKTAAEHLNEGGVLVTSPEMYKETFHSPCVHHFTRSDKEKELTYIEYIYAPDPRDTTIETVCFLVLHEHGETNIEMDRHVTGLFPQALWNDLMREAGFQIEERTFKLGEAGQPYTLLVGTLA